MSCYGLCYPTLYACVYIYVYIYTYTYTYLVDIVTSINKEILGGAHGVMVIVVGNRHGDTSSKSGRD